jgi:hypothetical protein
MEKVKFPLGPSNVILNPFIAGEAVTTVTLVGCIVPCSIVKASGLSA